MNVKIFLLYCLSLVAIIVFLFISAPAPLPIEDKNQDSTIPIAQVFTMLAAENDVVRSIWTKEIVKAGKLAGLEFDEDWKLSSIEAGPLPALFLREIAKNMERNPLRLSLYLGSDYPISSSNKFSGNQLEKFSTMKNTLQPQFFLEQDTGLYTAMFADMAISTACIDCHNEHKDSPKNDWQLQEIMGATTWMYPKQLVSIRECLQLLQLFRDSAAQAYQRYLAKVNSFSQPPIIGKQWPRDGYFLPDAETFIAEYTDKASTETLRKLLQQSSHDKKP